MMKDYLGLNIRLMKLVEDFHFNLGKVRALESQGAKIPLPLHWRLQDSWEELHRFFEDEKDKDLSEARELRKKTAAAQNLRLVDPLKAEKL